MPTARELAFCRAYFECRHGVTAYRQAFRTGRLSDDTVAERAAALLVREDISAELAALRAAGPAEPRAAPAAIDRDWVLRRLVENVERALRPRTVRGMAGGAGYNGTVVNRALELLGKELGMFAERRAVRSDPLAAETDEELNAVIRRLLKELGLAADGEGTTDNTP